jgi:hypothetical protein
MPPGVSVGALQTLPSTRCPPAALIAKAAVTDNPFEDVNCLRKVLFLMREGSVINVQRTTNV